jgi:outer membrane protein assembly factor BamB
VRKGYRFYLIVAPALLLCASLLSACQGPTDKVQACNPKSLPVVKTLASVQSSSQTAYAASGPNLYAFNAGSGAPRWCSKITLGNGEDRFKSMASDGHNVYTYTMEGDTTAFNSGTGAIVWSDDTKTDYAGFNKTPSPLLVHTTIYTGSPSLYALNSSNGTTNWQYTLPSDVFINEAPVESEGKLFIGTNSFQQKSSGKLPDQMYGLDAATGNKLWTFSLKQNAMLWGDLAASNGVIVFPYQESVPLGSNSSTYITFLQALNAQNGKAIWQKELGLPNYPVAANGLLYVAGFVPDDKNEDQILYALDIRTGTVRWSLTNKVASDDPFLVSNTTLYTANSTGKITAFDALTGELLWQGQLRLSTETALTGRLALLDNRLFVGTESANFSTHPDFYIHAFNLTTHQEDWQANITGVETSDGVTMSVGV